MAAPITYPVNATTPLLELTRPKPDLWIIELKNGKDNRLATDFVNKSIKPALDEVERQWRAQWGEAQKTKKKELGNGALIIVGRKDQDKFFSNGLDFENAIKDPNFFPDTFNPMLTRILTFPIPTIAAINGHCFAGGLMMSLACDYRIMTDGTKRNTWLCMNEVHFGAPWPLSFAALLRGKVGDHRLQRKIALEGHRFTPQEALKDGILDALVDGKTADILAAAEKLAAKFSPNAAAGVWGLIKHDLYRDTIKEMGKRPQITSAIIHDASARAKL
ncbi:ClpP/crotonase-like domain-containing protein [Ephemerocybe angulata]|uniref:ClpP/crotonase-like domain-containing protein n=1 Tax=Ephemerocybe angulata TaxID=980116 RepID=A0A8H6I4B1_9AGAR|nr:ClpP/crotonase-like domain-containing protein [Tulosesus angulatus]